MISRTELRSVTPDAKSKPRFVIVDAVGVTETELSDSYTLNRKRTVPFDKLLDQVSMGSRDPDALSSLASRLARLETRLSARERQAIESAAHGATLPELISGLLSATDPDAALEAAQQATGQEEPEEAAVAQAGEELLEKAAQPFAANPQLRQLLVDIHKSYEQTIDTVSADQLIEAGFSDAEAGRAGAVLSGIHTGEPGRDYGAAAAVRAPLPAAAALRGYQGVGRQAAIAAVDVDDRTHLAGLRAAGSVQSARLRPAGAGRHRVAGALTPPAPRRSWFPLGSGPTPVSRRGSQRRRRAGGGFSAEQRRWLVAIRDHIAGSVSIDLDDFQFAPFIQHGAVFKGPITVCLARNWPRMLEELNLALAA